MIKFSIAYYLIIIYVSIMFKPMIPLIIDAFDHSFAKAEHIATIHAVYGDNHTEADVAKAGGENSSDKNQNTVKCAEYASVHLFCPKEKSRIVINPIHTTYSSLIFYNIPDTFISITVPPPKTLV